MTSAGTGPHFCDRRSWPPSAGWSSIRITCSPRFGGSQSRLHPAHPPPITAVSACIQACSYSVGGEGKISPRPATLRMVGSAACHMAG